MALVVATEDAGSAPEECVLNHPHADIILRSSDSREFRVPRLYIIDSSPVLAALITASIPDISNSPDSNAAIRTDASRQSLPVYHLSDCGDVLSSILSYVILSMTPSLPPTIEKIMELLSVAQKYEMGSALAHIRGHISQQNPPLIRKSTAFHAYSLAQQYGLRQEALQAAQLTLTFPLSIESLESTAELSIVPTAFLYELLCYHARVQQFFEYDLARFMTGTAGRINVRCRNLDKCNVPIWLGDYVHSLADSPALLDLSNFHMAMMRHIVTPDSQNTGHCTCAAIDSKIIDAFWTALEDVVQDSMGYAGTRFVLGVEKQKQGTAKSKVTPPESLHTRSADVILRSSDLVDFRVHKSILSISSPFFGDMFSLPQPPLVPGEMVDELPVVQLSECAEVLLSLVTMLYPIPVVMPDSYDDALALLAASQKYDMSTVKSTIRSEMKSRNMPTPRGALAFRAYGIASGHGLITEMETAARLTLEYPMTFEFIGEDLTTFGGLALRDLAHYRKRCRDSLIQCLKSLLNSYLPPLNIWVGCPISAQSGRWMHNLFTEHQKSLKESFTHSLPWPSFFCTEYLAALQAHISKFDCSFCSKVHVMHGEKYREQVETMLANALDEVPFHPESTQDDVHQPELY